MDRNEKVKIFFDDTQKYLKNNYGISFRKDMVSMYVEKMDKSSVLDIGCGDGSLSYFLLNGDTKLTLADISPNMLSIAKSRFSEEQLKGVSFLCGDIEEQEFKKEKFDLVLAIGILAHVSSVKTTVTKISSITSAQGYLVVQFTDHSSFLSKVNSFFRSLRKATNYNVNRTAYHEIVELLEQNDFVVKRADHYSILLPGFGFFGDKFLYRYTRTMYQFFKGRVGTDVLLLAQKK